MCEGISVMLNCVKVFLSCLTVETANSKKHKLFSLTSFIHTLHIDIFYNDHKNVRSS